MSMCNVVGVLGDHEGQMWETFSLAVDLAEREHARLTLVKTCEDPRAYVWVTPFALGGAYVPPTIECPDQAAKILAGAAALVPNSMPVTTVVLGGDTQKSLLKLLREGHYGALVASEDLIRHCRRLRRQLHDDQIRTVSVTRPAGELGADWKTHGPQRRGQHHRVCSEEPVEIDRLLAVAQALPPEPRPKTTVGGRGDETPTLLDQHIHPC